MRRQLANGQQHLFDEKVGAGVFETDDDESYVDVEGDEPVLERQYRAHPMKLPGGDAAIVDLRKLTDYCLNPEHPRGKHKARVFATLGFTAENAGLLRDALLEAAASGDAYPTTSDQYGDRYVIEFRARGPRASGVIRSAWIVRRAETTPRLTSCFVK